MATQLALDKWTPPHPSPSASLQSVELARVAGKNAPFVFAWFALRLAEAPSFHGSDLEEDVRANTGATYGSGLRVLRDLKTGGFLDYAVENRRASLYRALWVRP